MWDLEMAGDNEAHNLVPVGKRSVYASFPPLAKDLSVLRLEALHGGNSPAADSNRALRRGPACSFPSALQVECGWTYSWFGSVKDYG
jgi:hypothetical protein